MRDKFHGILGIAAVLVCVVWFNSDLRRADVRLTAYHDNLDGAYPLRVEAARQWRNGQVPLWNPYKRVGMPLLADTTAGAIYPGNAPFLFGPGERRYLRLDQVAVLHFLLAGIFMYGLLRGLVRGVLASVFGAVAFAGSGTLLWFAAWYIQMQNSIVWLPAILAAVERSSITKRFFSWVGIGALAVAMQFFAGYPEYSAYTAIIAAGYACVTCGGGRGLRPLAAVMAIYVFGCALAAVQLLPALELQSFARRPLELSLAAFQSLPAPLVMPIAWLIPGLHPNSAFPFPPAGALFVGAPVAALAIAGCCTLDRRRLFFLAVLLAGALLAMGPATPASGLAYKIPGLRAFRHAFKHLLEVSVVLPILAAFGADSVLRGGRTARFAFGAAAAAVAGAVLYWDSTLPACHVLGLTGLGDTSAARVMGSMLLAIGAMAACGLHRAAILAALALTCTTSALNRGALLKTDWRGVPRSHDAPAAVTRLGRESRVLVPRFYFQPRTPSLLIGDFPSEFQIYAIHGAGPYLWRRLARATGMLEEEVFTHTDLFRADNRYLDVLSGRYILLGRTANGAYHLQGAVRTPAYTLIEETPDYRLMERSSAHARFRFVSRVHCLDADSIRERTSQGVIDTASVALLECVPDDRPPSSDAAEQFSLDLIEERPAYVRLRSRGPEGERAVLIISQSDFPGWHAEADTGPLKILRAYDVIQAIEVPGGEHDITLRYQPRSFVYGCVVSAIAGFALTAATLLSGWRRLRDKLPRGQEVSSRT